MQLLWDLSNIKEEKKTLSIKTIMLLFSSFWAHIWEVSAIRKLMFIKKQHIICKIIEKAEMIRMSWLRNKYQIMLLEDLDMVQ